MARFLVIGAAALDRPIWLSGDIRPGARLRSRSLSARLEGRLGGGGANAAVALRRAGHEVRLAAAPDPQDAAEILERAAAAGLDVSLCMPGPSSGGATLILIAPDGDRIVLSLDRPMGGPRPAIAPPGPATLRPDGLLIRAAYEGAAEWAERAAGPVLLHQPSGPYPGPADVMVASADDLSAEAREDPYAEGRTRLDARHADRLRWVVVTHGASGAVAHGPRERLSVPGRPARALDATGAGDIFAAGLLEALAAGADMTRALAHACAWGAMAVGLASSAPVEVAEGGFPAFRL